MVRNGDTGWIRLPEEGRSVDGLGVRITVSAAETGGLCSAMEIAHAETGGPPLHVHHRHDEMLYVLEGEYRVQIGEAVVAAPAGTVAYARRGTPHTYASVRPGRILSMVTPGGLEQYVAELDQLVREGASDDAIACLNRAWATEIVGPTLSPPASHEQ